MDSLGDGQKSNYRFDHYRLRNQNCTVVEKTKSMGKPQCMENSFMADPWLLYVKGAPMQAITAKNKQSCSP